MRAALFSDVHGNLPALEAVLADAAGQDVDRFVIAGDLVAHGPHPGAVIRRLMAMPRLRAVKGNTDRYVLTGAVSAMVPDDRQTQIDAHRGFAWTAGALAAVGGRSWLDALPMELRLELPDGTRVLVVHARPGTDDGPGLFPEMSDPELADAVADCGADLVLVGHTHVPMDRTVNGIRVLNLGSVSNPVTSDSRAMWTLLVADQNGYQAEHRRVEYDLHAVARAVVEVGHPSAGWLSSKLLRHV